jgi:hypothetical protein
MPTQILSYSLNPSGLITKMELVAAFKVADILLTLEHFASGD